MYVVGAEKFSTLSIFQNLVKWSTIKFFFIFNPPFFGPGQELFSTHSYVFLMLNIVPLFLIFYFLAFSVSEGYNYQLAFQRAPVPRFLGLSDDEEDDDDDTDVSPDPRHESSRFHAWGQGRRLDEEHEADDLAPEEEEESKLCEKSFSSVFCFVRIFETRKFCYSKLCYSDLHAHLGYHTPNVSAIVPPHPAFSRCLSSYSLTICGNSKLNVFIQSNAVIQMYLASCQL